MEVKPGYKQTAVGVIPEDWGAVNLSQLADVIGGGTPSTSIAIYWNGSIDWYTPTEIGYQKYSTTSIRKITKSGLDNSSAKLLPSGTVLMTSRASIGDLMILQTPAATNQGFQSLVSKQICFNEYLYYQLVIRENELLRNSSGSTFLEINSNKVKAIYIPLPPTKAEQRAIATALSDVDALLDGLDRLIAKKRDLKQAAMQQLLTGKTSLPGFEGKWEMTDISSVTDSHKQGYFTHEKYTRDGVRLVRITDLGNPDIDYQSMPCLPISNNDYEQYKIARGDFLFARSGAIGRYGIVEDDTPAIFGSYIIRFRFNKTKLVNRFFCYLFETAFVWEQLGAITQGSSNININANNIGIVKQV